MHRKTLFLFLAIFTSHSFYGQNEILYFKLINDKIKTQLNTADYKKIEALEADDKEALDLMQSSDKNYEELSNIEQLLDSEKDKKKREKILKKARGFETKAIKNRIEALKKYHEVYVQKYKIYKADLRKFFAISEQNQKDSAIILEKMAYDAFESADLDIDRVYYTINPSDLFELFTRACQSEQLGLLYQEKMYGIFMNWESSLQKRLDQEIEAIKLNRPIEQYQTEKNTAQIKDSLNIQTILIYDTVKVEKIEDLIIYKVQIAASKTQLDIGKLRSIYHEDQLIHYEIENGWYKYSVGFFTHYQDAQNYKKNIGVPDAFIIAYKRGKKVPIEELKVHPSFLKN